ncbi:MAG: electron transport complex subunit E [Sedimenticolaceae bacterium]
MSGIDYKAITLDGLWRNNQALVALLGLCPLLAVTNTLINGLGLGIATTLVLLLSNVSVSIIRNWVRTEIRLPVFVLIIASFVTAVELTMNAYFHGLYTVLGIFIPLIVTNCAIIGRAEAFASRNPVMASAVDALAMGIGFTAALVVLGALREFIGQGTLFDGAHLMFGESALNWTMHFGDNYEGILLAILPPGAFLGLGFLIAIKNVIDQRLSKKPAVKVTEATATES